MTEQLPDQALREWRDALTSGGLPTPQRKRWQPLRAGVVNLWEFEAVEYWYANGWAQLIGRNETGKSSLMALTTLIPWLGDTASDKIDTLGRSGKQFAYYVRPGGESDRRSTDASLFHGWLWVEYGRVRNDTPEFFTTLLYASARTGSSNTRLVWCTSQDSRVRDALRLTDGRAVRPPKEIDAPGFEAHDKAGSYRERVASRLLGGSVAQLESIGKLLKVTRQPKLGAQLQTSFVTSHLRDSLPELNRSEVEQLATGWDQLDQLRDDLERAQRAATEVARFQTAAWQPWATNLLRLRADEVATKQTALDAVTREERLAEAELATSAEAEARLAQQRHEAHELATTNHAQAASLRESSAFVAASQRAENVQRKKGEVDQAARLAHRSHQAAEAADGRERDAVAALTSHQGELARALKRAAEQEDRLRTAARPAGVTVANPLDADQLGQACTDRSAQVREVDGLRRRADRAAMAAATADQIADNRQQSADASRQRAEAAEASAADERERLVRSLHAWMPADASEHLPDWLSVLPDSADDLTRPRLVDLVRRDYHEPRHADFASRRASAHAAWQTVGAELSDVQRQIDQLSSETLATVPAPELWRRRNRDDKPGAPFWRLVNPLGEVSPVELAHLEAALAASGLLDAWVSHETMTGLDAWLNPDTPPEGRTLASVLGVDESAGELTALVHDVLSSIVLLGEGEALPTSGAAVALDGRWRLANLTGRAAPRHDQAEWLGEAAREARRQRQLAELRARAVELEGLRMGHRDDERHWDEEISRLAATLRAAPSDEALRSALLVWSEHDQRAEADQLDADRALQAARQARVQADQSRAELLRAASEHRLPSGEAELDQVRRQLDEVRAGLGVWRERNRTAQRAHEVVAAAEGELDRRRSEAAEQRAKHEQDEQQFRLVTAQLDALQASVNADDRQILDELGRLERAAREAESEREALDQRRGEVAARRGSAEQKLADVARRRAEATEVRAEAHLRLRELIDGGLLAGLGVDLPEPASSGVDQVRAQAAELRRALRPKNWQDGSQRDGAEHNARLVEAARRALDSQARDARAVLEQGGRSMRVLPDEPIPTVEVVVNSNGLAHRLFDAGDYLRGVCAELEGQYSDSVRETLDRLLGSTFLEHMRDRIGQATRLVDEINEVLRQHPTGTDRTTMRIRLEPGSNASILSAVSGPSLMDPEVASQVRHFLKQKVDEAKRAASDEGRADWHDSLAAHLDYRSWYEVSLESRVADGRWGPLSTRRFAELSGGARAVMLMLPLIAALAAQYERLPGSPRPLWLDEAFDGLDAPNKSMVMSLLQRFDLDVLVAGPGRLVNVDVVPAAAIYQVLRAASPEPGADLEAELWAGRTLEALELPISWLDEPKPSSPGQDSLL